MQYLLDTNICVALIRQRPAAVLNQITRHTIMEIGISTLTIAELQYGVDKSSKPQHN